MKVRYILCFVLSSKNNELSFFKILHGDLALRNVLLSENNVIKICDFGLSKNLYTNINYQKLSDSPLPVKWLALETLNYRSV